MNEDKLRIKYKAYLLSFLFCDIDEIIDTEPMSYEEFIKTLKD